MSASPPTDVVGTRILSPVKSRGVDSGMARYQLKAPKAENVDVRFVRDYLLSDAGIEQLQRASPGSADRNRTLSIKNFENIVIPLPDPSEQERISARINRIAISAGLFTGETEPAQRRLSILPRITGHVLADTALPIRVGDLCTMVNDLVRPGEDPGEAREFVGLEHIESHSGRRVGAREIGGEKGRKLRFRPGDVLYGYLRPYLNKVWLADRHGLCSVEQYVLRPNHDVRGDHLSTLLRSSTVLDEAVRLTHSLQLPRLRSGLLLDLRVPDPREIAAEDWTGVGDALSRAIRASDLRLRRQQLGAALLPAARNEEFARLM